MDGAADGVGMGLQAGFGRASRLGGAQSAWAWDDDRLVVSLLAGVRQAEAASGAQGASGALCCGQSARGALGCVPGRRWAVVAKYRRGRSAKPVEVVCSACGFYLEGGGCANCRDRAQDTAEAAEERERAALAAWERAAGIERD